MSVSTPRVLMAREIVGQRLQRHLGGNPSKHLHQEAGLRPDDATQPRRRAAR